MLNNLNLDNSLVEKINGLLERKKRGIELELEPKIQMINEFIETKMKHFEEFTFGFNPRQKPDSHVLDQYFVRILHEVNDA